MAKAQIDYIGDLDMQNDKTLPETFRDPLETYLRGHNACDEAMSAVGGDIKLGSKGGCDELD